MDQFERLPKAERIALTRQAALAGEPLMICWDSLDPAVTDRWSWRTETAAQWLEDAQAVVDFGCGNMTLERYLGSEQGYIPVDLVARDSRTIVLDLNKVDVPALGSADACAVLGVLEYLLDPARFLRQLNNRFALAVVSFVCRADAETEESRTSMGWLNHHDHSAIRKEFEAAGFNIDRDVAVEGRQRLFRLNPARAAR
jgi:hypothetical protein